MANTMKMTNSMAISYVLENCTLPADVVEKLENIKASIDKKNAHSSDKPSKKQVENEGIKAQIIEVLKNAEEPMTVGQVAKAINIESNQKVSALMTQLKKAEIIKREEIKKVAYFSMADNSDNSEDEDELSEISDEN